jgi:hypothetical protein
VKLNSFKLSNTDKSIIYIVLFVPMLVMIGFAIRGAFFNDRSSRDYFLETREKESFHGVVDSIFWQKDNHNVKTLKSDHGVFEIERVWENKFKVGDSVSKHKGCLLVEHYRNGKLLEVLNYEDLRKK